MTTYLIVWPGLLNAGPDLFLEAGQVSAGLVHQLPEGGSGLLQIQLQFVDHVRRTVQFLQLNL